jgi:hypothetical protein
MMIEKRCPFCGSNLDDDHGSIRHVPSYPEGCSCGRNMRKALDGGVFWNRPALPTSY